jgi:hypothetical protein
MGVVRIRAWRNRTAAYGVLSRRVRVVSAPKAFFGNRAEHFPDAETSVFLGSFGLLGTWLLLVHLVLLGCMAASRLHRPPERQQHRVRAVIGANSLLPARVHPVTKRIDLLPLLRMKDLATRPSSPLIDEA